MRIEKVKEKTFGYHNYDKKEIKENGDMILKWISNNVKNYQFYKYSARKPTLSLDRGMNGGHG